MAKFLIIQLVWDLDDDPDGNVQHIARHGVTPEEVEEILFDPTMDYYSNPATGHFNTDGVTRAGRLIRVAWVWADAGLGIAYVVTAYGPGEEDN